MAIDKDNYWQYYRLREDPFGEPNDQLYYVPLEEREHLLELLQHLIHYSNVLLSVVGVKGSGKSTLLRRFKQPLLAEGLRVIHLVASLEHNPNKLFGELCQHVHFTSGPSEATKAGIAALIDHLKRESDVVLLIDNAHDLPLLGLELLLKIVEQQGDDHMPLHIVLFGEPELYSYSEKIAQKRGLSDKVHSLVLEGLSLEQTERYLSGKLNAAGWNQRLPFLPSDLQKIWKLTHGIPSRMNRVAKQLLFEKLLKSQQRAWLSWETMKERKFTMASLLVVLGLLFMLPKLDPRWHGAQPSFEMAEKARQKIAAQASRSSSRASLHHAAIASTVSPLEIIPTATAERLANLDKQVSHRIDSAQNLAFSLATQAFEKGRSLHLLHRFAELSKNPPMEQKGRKPSGSSETPTAELPSIASMIPQAELTSIPLEALNAEKNCQSRTRSHCLTTVS